MKKFLLFTLTFGLFTYAFSQQYGWQVFSAYIPQTGEQPPDLSELFFISDNEGWITSSNYPEIYHTTDGGETFEIQSTQYDCNAIYMLNENEGYAGGENGRVYHTTNGGENWIAIGSIGTTLLDISFPFDAGPVNPIGYASGDNGTVYSITPQGVLNLNSQLVITLGGISAPSDSNVWVCGGNRIYYYDGTGYTSQIAPTGTFNDIHFINNQEGWVVGDGGIIGYTIDGGANWNTQTNPDTQDRSLYGVFFLDANNGWAVSNGGVILHTTNGGTNWLIEREGSTSEFLRGVHFTSPTNGYVVGNEKTLLKYTEVSGVDEKFTLVVFEVHPNPVKDKLKITCTGFKTENGIIEILSLDGKLLIRKEVAKGNANREIDMSNLVTGMYLCKISIGNRSSAQKIIKE